LKNQEGKRIEGFNQQSKVNNQQFLPAAITSVTFQPALSCATFTSWAPEPVPPDTNAHSATAQKIRASAKNFAASASRGSTSASAATALCTANPAARPATTRPPRT